MAGSSSSWLPVLGHGPTGVTGSIALALSSAGAAIGMWWLHGRRRVAVWLGSTALVTGLSAPWIGRMPGLVAVTATCALLVALDRLSDGRATVWTKTTLGVLVLGSVLWGVTQSNLTALVWLLTTAAIAGVGAWLDRTDGSPPSARAVNLAPSPDGRAAGGLRDATGALPPRPRRTSILLRLSEQATRHPRITVSATACLAGLVTAPIFLRAAAGEFERIRGTNDILGTLDRVRWMQWSPLRLPVPHPSWTLLVKLLSPLLGETGATVAILTCATAASVAVLAWVARSGIDGGSQLTVGLSAAFGGAYVFAENPALLAPVGTGWWSRYGYAGAHARGQGYLPLHQWATPTIVLSMPLVFALFAALLGMIRHAGTGERADSRWRWGLGLLTVASTLTQPATTLIMLPAIPMYLMVTGLVTRNVLRHIAWFVIPGLLVCGWQTWFLASAVSPWEQATWIWRPGWAWRYFGLNHPAFWTSLAVGAVGLLAGGRRYTKDPGVRLAAVGSVVGLVPFVLFEMTGIYGPDGDLGVPAMMGLILFVVFSFRFLLGELQSILPADRMERIPWWAPAAALLIATFLAAGTTDLLTSSGLLTEL